MRKEIQEIIKPKRTRTRYGTISQRLSSRRFKVMDENNFEFLAEADTDWGVGAKVVVQNGFIVGSGRRSGTYTHFTL